MWIIAAVVLVFEQEGVNYIISCLLGRLDYSSIACRTCNLELFVQLLFIFTFPSVLCEEHQDFEALLARHQAE